MKAEQLMRDYNAWQQQQRPDIRLIPQMHVQPMSPAAMAPHPGIPVTLSGLGSTAGLPVPTSAALLNLGLAPGTTTANPVVPTGATAHSLSMLGKPDIHRGQPDDLKSSSGKSR